MLSRRALLGGAVGLAGCAGKKVRVATPAAPAVRLTRVKVAKDRVIRETVGLRPFRPSGFVVRGEKLGEKTVIHNYGHGGSGITLSWGTAQLAVEEGAKVESRDLAVIGCGVVGLSTARLLQQRGQRPVIYAKEMPPATTSSLAGGLWEPVSLFDQPKVTQAFQQQFVAASRIAFKRYQSMAGDWYGVRWLPMYSLGRDAAAVAAPPEDSPLHDIETLYPEARDLTPEQNPFGTPFARHRDSMLIEPAIYLNALMRDYLTSGGRIEVREFHDVRELQSLRENVLYNCTGLGARGLFGDTELIPIRGQLVFLLPQPEVDYMMLGPGVYMFPRHDGILLGGSFERGVENTDVDPAVTERILRGNAELFAGMK